MTSKQETEQQNVKSKPKVDLMPKWALEKDCYKDAKIRDIARGEWHNWPYIPADAVEQTVFKERFLDKIIDEDGYFYPKRDEEGKPVKTTPDNIPKYVVISIIRYKQNDGSEWLLSKGNFIAYDALGDEVRHYVSKPEVWKKTTFAYEKEWDDKRKAIVKNCKGPNKVENIYTLPFNEKNLKDLFDKRQDDNINWTVKDDKAARIVSAGSNINDTFKLFLKPFSYLMDAQYLTPEMKAQYRQEAIDAGILSAPNAAATVPQTSTPPKSGAYL